MINPRDLPLLVIFAAVAKEGSFTRASAQLGYTKSVVSAAVRTLEAKYEVQLLHRTTRSVRTTAPGAAALEAIERLLREARSVEDTVAAFRVQPEGQVRVAAPHGLASGMVARAVAASLAMHAGVRIELVVDDAVSDLVAKGIDVAVRIGLPKDSSYMFRRLGESAVILAAAPGVVTGVRRPSELSGVRWLRHVPFQSARRLAFTGPRGAKDVVQPSYRAEANTMDVFRALLLEGAGVGAVPEVDVAGELRRGSLVRVCPGWARRSVTIFALMAGSKPSPAARVFVDALRATVEG